MAQLDKKWRSLIRNGATIGRQGVPQYQQKQAATIATNKRYRAIPWAYLDGLWAYQCV